MPVLAFHGTADRIVPYEGKGRELPPIREWAASWATRNGCGSSPRQVFNEGEVAAASWEGCKDGATVTLYTIDGGGHTWPGAGATAGWEAATKDINATDVIWDFFAAHPKR